VDARIRALTMGQRSLDDFCRHFFGGHSGAPVLKPYSFDDLVSELNAVAAYDWKDLLTRRLTATTDQAPLEGIVRGGWRLTHSDKPTELSKTAQAFAKTADFSSSIGLLLSPEGSITDVIPDSPADRAGLAPGMKLAAINSRRWSAEGMTAAVAATKKPGHRLELLAENGEFFHTHHVVYQGGEKHARLERDSTRPDLLALILKPRVAPPPASGPGNGK
jgi:predicted metalloprotease with PDZ domain